MKAVIDTFKDQFKKKKKKNWLDEPGEDHPVHEEYTKQKPVKK